MAINDLAVGTRLNGRTETLIDHPEAMEDEEWVYAWEEDLYDEDGKLWILTMFSLMIAPIYEEMRVKPALLGL